MLRKCLVAIGLSAWAALHPSLGHAMERTAMDQLLAMAKSRSDTPEFREALVKRLGDAPIKSGEAFDSNGPDFIWAVEATAQPTLVVDDQPVGAMRRISGSNLWFHTGQLRVGTSHRFHYLIDGKKFGGSFDMPAYGPLSYTRPGVPQGRISEKLVHTSKLYGGMETNYWIYVPAQYNPSVPAALMVWQDGERYITRNVEEQCRLCPSLYRLQEVTDNLIHDKKIPVMIHVFVSPGTLNGKSLRAVLYDTVSDKYSQFLRDELLPEVYAKYNIRKDAYSRAIQGQSSGGIAAFTVAWNHPDDFSRVYTVVGSFVAHRVEARRDRWRQRISVQGSPRAEAQSPRVAERRIRRSGDESGQLALAEHPACELAEAERVRLPFQLRWRIASCRACRIGTAGMPHLAVARLRSGEDRTGVRAERRGKSEAAVPRAHLQPLARRSLNFAAPQNC